MSADSLRRRRRLGELHFAVHDPFVEVVRRARRYEARDFGTALEPHALPVGHAHRAAGRRDFRVAGAHREFGRAARRDVDSILARLPEGDRRVQRDDLEGLVVQQVVQVHARGAGVELESDRRGVEVGDRDGGGLVETKGCAAEGDLRASVAGGREPIASVQRPVGQGGGRHFLRALEAHFALDVGQAGDAFRRLERLAGGEARGREREDYEDGAQHDDPMIRLGRVNGS